MRHLRRHTNRFAKGRMRVNRLADIHRVGTHFNRQRNLADHVLKIAAPFTFHRPLDMDSIPLDVRA